MSIRRALLLSGSGMLSECAADLVAAGWHVVLPSRRHCPLPVEYRAPDPRLTGVPRARGGEHRAEARQDRYRSAATGTEGYRPGSAAAAALPAQGNRRTGERSAPAREPEKQPCQDGVRPGRALWVEADWAQPDELARRASRALAGTADLLVAWLHESYRDRVMSAVQPLLAAEAKVVEVYGGAVDDPSDTHAGPSLRGHPTQQVVLGFTWQGPLSRWLTRTEIADGVRSAVRRAVQGLPPSVHQVGETRPFALHS